MEMTNKKRFERQIRLFGKEGQEKIRSAVVTVVGIGGLGTHVVQQLVLLGVGELILIDPQELDESNRNRYIGARHDDPIPGTPKVDIGQRVIQDIDPSIRVLKLKTSLISQAAFTALARASHVFGCLDSEGARLVLNEFCSAHCKPYFDLASDVVPGDPPVYGGEICIAWNGRGCLVCRGRLDLDEAQMDLAGEGAKRDRDAIYGVPEGVLDVAGPSVVSVNGVIASFAVTEFMAAVTGMRDPVGFAEYRGNLSKIFVSTDAPTSNCYYCTGIRGKGDAANLERYLE